VFCWRNGLLAPVIVEDFVKLAATCYKRKALVLSMSLLLSMPVHAGSSAGNNEDLTQLRKDFEAMKASYEARIRGLEQRLEQSEGKGKTTQTSAKLPAAAAPAGQVEAVIPVTAASAPAPAPAPVATQAATSPSPSAPPSSIAAFNPGISLILSGIYANTSQDPSTYKITGYPLPNGAEIGPGQRGFSLAESELGIYGTVDPYFRGAMNVALAPDNSVSVEEAYIATLGLSHGFTIKAGRFLSDIGYLNDQHAHTWDFVDSPLPYQAFLGGQYDDDGVQLHWLAPTDTYLEFGGELGRGRGYPGTDNNGNRAGAFTLYVHTGGDVGYSNSWRAGLSYLQADPQERLTAMNDFSGNEVSNSYSGTDKVFIADAVWKWAPNGNSTDTNFKLQGEYLRHSSDGNLTYDTAGAANTGAYSATQSGWYLQGVYQFMPYWRVGLRAEQLYHGSVDFGSNADALLASDYDPSRYSLMVDYSPSEFSRIRLQFSQDHAREGLTDNQVYLQYQMSLGAHGAHIF
jgi:hypothetical protein